MKAAVLSIAALLVVSLVLIKQADAKAQGQDALYRTKCSACHRVYPPMKHTYQKFETYVVRYGKGLTEEERRNILKYLRENSKKGGE